MMRNRLDFIANDVPQLANVIFAVSEWVANVASRNDVEQFLLHIEDQGGGAGSADNKTKNSVAGPLKKILARVLLDQPGSRQRQDTSTILIAGCANLVATVLLSPACNVKLESGRKLNSVAQSSSMRKVLGEILRRGRALAFQMETFPSSENAPTSRDVAMGISSCILELLQHASREKRTHESQLEERVCAFSIANPGEGSPMSAYSCQDKAEEIVRLLDIDINSLTSKLTNRDCYLSSKFPPQRKKVTNGFGSKPPIDVVLNQLANRDRLKQLADKSGMRLDVFLGQMKVESKKETVAMHEAELQTSKGNKEKKSQQQQSSSSAHYQSLEAKQEFIQKIIGSSLHSSVTSTIDEVQTLKGKIKELHSEKNCKQNVLTSRRNIISSKREEISQRMENLRKELEQLKTQEKQLAEEETAVVTELERMDLSSGGEIKSLEDDVNSKISYMAVDREVRGVVEKMGELELAWIQSVSSSGASSPALQSPINKKSIVSLIPLKLEKYLSYAHSYLKAEAKYMEFLRSRVSSMEAYACDLDCKIGTFSALGKSNDAEALACDLEHIKSQLDEDKVVIEALSENVNQIWSVLIRRVEGYMALGGEGSSEIPDLETLKPCAMLIAGISAEVTRIDSNISQDDNVISRFLENSTFKPSLLKDAVGNLAGSTTGKNASPNSSPEVMPKFSWADKTNHLPKKEARSLLDIQKEELSLREKKNTNEA